MMATIYLRSLIATLALSATVCYLNAPDVIPELIAGCVAIVYIDKNLSGDK